jgi:hypothetical protein
MHARSSGEPRSNAGICGALYAPAGIPYEQVSAGFGTDRPRDSQAQSLQLERVTLDPGSDAAPKAVLTPGRGIEADMKEELHDLVSALGADIHDRHYQPAYNAAASICSGVFESIPVDLHILVQEAAAAGYAAALSDLENGKLDEQIRERSKLLE